MIATNTHSIIILSLETIFPIAVLSLEVSREETLLSNHRPPRVCRSFVCWCHNIACDSEDELAGTGLQGSFAIPSHAIVVYHPDGRSHRLGSRLAWSTRS
jgi:hypothetical protein